MTKEELEKEAEGYTNKLLEDWELYDPEALQEAYLASAEPREKRIEELQHKIDILQGFLDRDVEYQELQKENAELKKACDETQELLDKQIEATYKLDKENAELKKMYHESDEDNNKLRENIPILAEAKDHIKKLLDCLKQDTNDPQTNYYVCQYMDKAEQFLKDFEVEK